MAEKRSETQAIKPRLTRLAFHSALAIYILFPSLVSLTWLMCGIRHGPGPNVFEPRHDCGKSNNSTQETRLRTLLVPNRCALEAATVQASTVIQ